MAAVTTRTASLPPIIDRCRNPVLNVVDSSPFIKQSGQNAPNVTLKVKWKSWRPEALLVEVSIPIYKEVDFETLYIVELLLKIGPWFAGVIRREVILREVTTEIY